MKFFKKPEYWLIGLIVFHISVNLFWLSIDKTPPAWDQAAHIRSMVLASNGGNFIDLVRSFGGYPPLIYLIGGVWVSIFGVGVSQITGLNTLFLVMAIVGVYKLGELITKNKIIALLGAVLFSLFPVVYDISRNMLLDLPLTVFVVWGLYFWLKKNDVGVLTMLILASLTKLNGFIYFGPMGLFYLWEARNSGKLFLRLLIGGLIYGVVVGWWWTINWQNIYQYLTGLAGSGEKLTDPMDLGSWLTWIHYFKLFFLHQVGPVVATVWLLVLGKVSKDLNNKKLIFWTILVYITFTIIKNKDFRFTMPLLPVVAVWLSIGLMQLKEKVLIGLFLSYLFFNFIENSFGWPIKKPYLLTTTTFVMGDVNWVNFSDYPVRATNPVEWPNEKIVKDMILAGNGNKSKVLVLTDNEQINDNNLKLYREMITDRGDSILEMHSVYGANFTDWQSFGAVLVGETGEEPAPFYATNLEYLKQARDFVWQYPDKFEKMSEYDLPNQKKLYLMRVR